MTTGFSGLLRQMWQMKRLDPSLSHVSPFGTLAVPLHAPPFGTLAGACCGAASPGACVSTVTGSGRYEGDPAAR